MPLGRSAAACGNDGGELTYLGQQALEMLEAGDLEGEAEASQSVSALGLHAEHAHLLPAEHVEQLSRQARVGVAFHLDVDGKCRFGSVCSPLRLDQPLLRQSSDIGA